MKKLLDLINKEKIAVADGAWGTMLQNNGLKVGECPELWNFSHPDVIRQIALEYKNAGAKLIKTNTFGANKFRLQHFGAEDKLAEINKIGAEITKDVCSADCLTLGSVGPTGKILMMGDVNSDEIYETFANQVTALEKGGADAILIETFSDIEEASLALKAVRENTSLEVIVSFTFEKTIENQYRTMMGYSPADFADNIQSDVLGTNCGNGYEAMVDILEIIHQVKPNIPLIVNANAGLPQIINHKIEYPETPEYVSSFVDRLYNAGARIIGGCCGTTPQHINMINEKVKNLIGNKLIN